MSKLQAKEIIKLINQFIVLCKEGNDMVAALDKELVALQDKAVEAQNKKVHPEEEPIFDWYDRKNGERRTNDFVGFAEFYLSDKLVAGKKYGFEVGPVVLVGEQLQMVVMLFDSDDGAGSYKLDCPAGVLVQRYKIGSPAFLEMVQHVYAPPFRMLVEICTKDIADAEGVIAQKNDENGKLVLDWTTFEPDQTPCGTAWDFSESLSAEMDDKECDTTNESKILRGQAA